VLFSSDMENITHINMSKQVFLISDTHFGHENMYTFLNHDGSRTRAAFPSVKEGDEAMIERWNATVKPTDKVYHLGDVWMNRKHRHVLSALHGDKVLIKGNHDIGKISDYTEFFRDVRACHVLAKCILSHIPIHRESMARFKGNIHGHLHGNRVEHDGKIDPLYFSVCVEQINYTPIPLDEALQRLQSQQ
jgi:calcineurin-like phosphoesterase family protein